MEAIHFLQDKGIEIPRDVSVAGFDDSPYAEICRPEITTVRQNIMKKGQEAVKRLTSLIQGRNSKDKRDFP
ncbi:MAG: substrate-binding domain-containing protein [Blautia marasmi]